MFEKILGKTLLGAAVGAVGSAGMGIYLNVAFGVGAFENWGVLIMLAVVGGTTGGLVGPLLFGRRKR